jgi:hypothetical protein
MGNRGLISLLWGESKKILEAKPFRAGGWEERDKLKMGRGKETCPPN